MICAPDAGRTKCGYDEGIVVPWAAAATWAQVAPLGVKEKPAAVKRSQDALMSSWLGKPLSAVPTGSKPHQTLVEPIAMSLNKYALTGLQARVGSWIASVGHSALRTSVGNGMLGLAQKPAVKPWGLAA